MATKLFELGLVQLQTVVDLLSKVLVNLIMYPLFQTLLDLPLNSSGDSYAICSSLFLVVGVHIHEIVVVTALKLANIGLSTVVGLQFLE